jgi:hypothetical protein
MTLSSTNKTLALSKPFRPVAAASMANSGFSAPEPKFKFNEVISK